jgi:sulfite reductase (ferredoxin)
MDVGLVGVERDDGRVGFDLWVGGGLGTNPMFAQRLGAFVPPDRAVEVATSITELFRDYGYRRSRTKARLKFLVKDWGPERVREMLEAEYLSGPLEDGPAPPESTYAHREHLGATRQRDGLLAVGLSPVAGRISGSQLIRVAELARRFGRGRVRNTTQQKMLILDVADEDLEPLNAELDAVGLPSVPGAVRTGTMACTGIEFCKLAVVETKHRAAWLIEELERRLPGMSERVRINLNGCPNSCARYQIADIGLMGSLVPGDNGERVDGFQVHLGGHLGGEYRFGKKVKGVRVAATDLPDFIELLVRCWLDEREEGEDFSGWVNRLPQHEVSDLMEMATA